MIKQQLVTRETGTIFTTWLSHLQDNFISFHTRVNMLQTGNMRSLMRECRDNSDVNSLKTAGPDIASSTS